MALLTCPDCSKQVSDLAPACPQCGRPAAPASPRPMRRMSRVARRFVLLAMIATCAMVLQEVRRAYATTGTTATPMAYSGTLLTFGAPDNGPHTIIVALFITGANDGGFASAACSVTAPVTTVNGQFTIPLSTSCQTVIQQNPNVQAEVIVDSVSLGLTSVTAVPYAVEAQNVAASGITGVLPISGGGTGSGTQNFVDLSTTQTVGGSKTFSSAVGVGGIDFPDGTVQTSAWGVEVFSAQLTNAPSIVAAGSGQLAYTSVLQQSSTAVFSMASNGALTILKAGTVSIFATFDVRTSVNYGYLSIIINGSTINDYLSYGNNAGIWGQCSGTLHWKVNAGDVLTFTAGNVAGSVDNGVWSSLSVQWMGHE